MTKGYWQVPIAEEDIKKTAFVTPDGDLVQVPQNAVRNEELWCNVSAVYA